MTDSPFIPCREAVAHGAVWRRLFGGVGRSLRSPRHFGLTSKEIMPQSFAGEQLVVRPIWFLRRV